MLTVKSTINVSGQSVPQIIPVVQGDTGRTIEFSLADFTIPTGSTARYYIQKPSGNAVYNNATIEDNNVVVNLTAQAIAETGDNYGQVRIENDGEIVTSFDFILLVKAFRGIGAVESETEMNIFDQAVEQAEAEITEAKEEALAEIGEAGSGNTAAEFDAADSYLAGEYVIYNAKLYKFTSAHTGLWTGSDVEELTVGDALTDLEEETTSLKEDLQDIEGEIAFLGLSEDVKQALLQIAQKVAYIDEHGQDYYSDLYDALYPPVGLVGISAVYTQSGAVYDTDTLDSLKNDLVVTALYDDQTTETVTVYTLSGTLTVGTSTITVLYGGKTTTFNVTVSENIGNLLYSFDFRNSNLTDSVNGVVAQTTATQESDGILFNDVAKYIYLNTDDDLSMSGNAVEIDIASMSNHASSAHGRLFNVTTDSSLKTNVSADSFIWKSDNTGWYVYNGSWSSTHIDGSLYDGSSLSGKTLRIEFDSSGYPSVLLDGTLLMTYTSKFSKTGKLVIGGSNVDYLKQFGLKISGVRIYEVTQ